MVAQGLRRDADGDLIGSRSQFGVRLLNFSVGNVIGEGGHQFPAMQVIDGAGGPGGEGKGDFALVKGIASEDFSL